LGSQNSNPWFVPEALPKNKLSDMLVKIKKPHASWRDLDLGGPPERTSLLPQILWNKQKPDL
jgi:hypothetical protein